MKQVNFSEKVNGESFYWISDHSDDGYIGKLVDSQYIDGTDTTDWCQFVGTEEDCQNYIKEKTII